MNENLEKERMIDVLMPAYNQEKYIRQAIESVLDQKTDYSFRLIIADDHSSDDTHKICTELAEKNQDRILYKRHPENMGMAANYKFLFELSDAKYICIHEGDDYWTDQKKIQKQVEILESDPEIGMIHTNFNCLYENGTIKKGKLWEEPGSNSGNVIGPYQIAKPIISPLTSCFRSELAKENVDFDFIIENNLLTVDVFLWAEICRRTKVYYMDEVTAVYRIHSSSITGNRNIHAIEKFHNTSMKLVNYLMEKYETPQEVKKEFVSIHTVRLIYEYLLARQPGKAREQLKNVSVVYGIKNKIIILSARYRVLNFLSRWVFVVYQAGSFVKQRINRIKKS